MSSANWDPPKCFKNSKRPRTDSGGGWQNKGRSGGWQRDKWKNAGRKFGASTSLDALTVTFALQSVTKFTAKSQYNEQLNQVWRSFGGMFDRDGTLWSLPLDKYTEVINALKDLDLKLDIKELPHFIRNGLQNGTFATNQQSKSLDAIKDDIKQRLPSKLYKALLPFQHEGVAKIVEQNGKALLGDEMGLGKTIQALSVASYYNELWPLLVICPSSLRHTWAAEIEKWLEIGQESISVITSGKDRPNNLINIVSYDLATKMCSSLKDFKVVIADESHYLKSPTTKRTLAVAPAIKNASCALLLSGTPALSRPIELYSQLNALLPDLFESRSSFGIRYCNGFQAHFGWDFSGSSNLPELHIVMANTILIRRLKRDVLDQLPAKTRQQVYVSPVPQLKRELVALEKQREDLEQKMKSASLESKSAIEMRKKALVTKMYQITGQSKLPDSLAYLDDLTEKGVKSLIFAHHREILDAISVHLAKKKVKHIRIDGATSQAIRQDLCNQFQTDEKTLMAVLSITAAGVGLTLHSAATVVFFELAWNPGQLLQAEDRAHRMGQQRSVDVKYMVAKGTADQRQWNLLQHKIGVVGQSVNGTHDTMSFKNQNDREDDSEEVVSSSKELHENVNDGKYSRIHPPTPNPIHDVEELRTCAICNEKFVWYIIDDHAAKCIMQFTAGAFSDDDE